MGLLAAVLVVPGPVPPAPEPLCTFADERLAEVSGLVAGPDGPVVVNDGGNPSTLYVLDDGGDECAVADTVDVDPAGTDVEDLALAADGTWWLADIGDNRRERESVAVLRIGPDGDRRETALVYADGPRDAEAMLLGSDDRPVIVTKDVGGRSGVYTTDAPLPPGDGGGPVTLRRVAEVVVPPTVTPGGGTGAIAAVGGGLITGGAVAPEGGMVALRTYTDAWLYAVGPDPATADALVAALGSPPVQVPLPGEPQGEAIAFTPDGTLLSASETQRSGARPQLRAVPGATELVAVAPDATTGSPPDGEPGSPPWAGTVIAAVSAVGGLGVAAALWWSRRRLQS